MIKKFLKYFTPLEWTIMLVTLTAISIGFGISKDRSALSYASSVVGVVSILFNSKGNVVGQFINIAFAALYGIYSYTQHYYGEMIIYFAIMTPIYVFSIVSWIKHKYNGRKNEVAINTLKKKEFLFAGLGALACTAAFYFLLRALDTDNLIVSTISLTTSISAAYLMLRRCEYYSVCFIFNDVILITLWAMKIPDSGLSVLPSVIAFGTFLIVDVYCFFSWRAIHRRQAQETAEQATADKQAKENPDE